MPGKTTETFQKLGFAGGCGSTELTSSTSTFEASDDEETTGNKTKEITALPHLELENEEDTELPTAPMGLAVSHREGDLVTVQWLPGEPCQRSNKVELPVLGYHLYIDGEKVEIISAGSSQATLRVSQAERHELFIRAVSAMGESPSSNLIIVPVQPNHLLIESDSEQPETRQIPRTVDESESYPERVDLKQSPRDRAVNLLSSLQQEILGSSSPQRLVSPMNEPGQHSPSFILDTDIEAKENKPPDHDSSGLANGEAAMPTQQNGHNFDLCLFKDQDQSRDQSSSESFGTESPTSILSLYSLPSTLPNLDFSSSVMKDNSTTN